MSSSVHWDVSNTKVSIFEFNLLIKNEENEESKTTRELIFFINI